MLIIGICGASGSGKSTLAEELAARLEGNCVKTRSGAQFPAQRLGDGIP